MSDTLFNINAKVLVVGSDDMCGFMIAKTFLKHLKNEIRVGYMYEHNPLTKEIEREGAKIMRYNLCDSRSMERLFEGIHCAVIVPPVFCHNYQKAPEMIEIAACSEHLKMFVMTSILHADKLGDWDRLKQICKMEKEFENKMKKWDKAYILRKSMPLEGFYMVRKAIQEKHMLPWVFGDNEIAPVSLCDVSKAIINLLCGKHRRENEELDASVNIESLTHHKHMFCLTGNRRKSGEEMAKECSEALDTHIKLKSMKIDELIECIRKEKEFPEEMIKFAKELLEATKEGYMDGQTRDLEHILGKKPMSVKEYFEENRKEFMPNK